VVQHGGYVTSAEVETNFERKVTVGCSTTAFVVRQVPHDIRIILECNVRLFDCELFVIIDFNLNLFRLCSVNHKFFLGQNLVHEIQVTTIFTAKNVSPTISSGSLRVILTSCCHVGVHVGPTRKFLEEFSNFCLSASGAIFKL
jgi:hypothetical protein